MNDNVINMQTARRTLRQNLAKGKTLCGSGFHKWQTDNEGRFDVKQGKLLTTEHCLRCNVKRARRL